MKVLMKGSERLDCSDEQWETDEQRLRDEGWVPREETVQDAEQYNEQIAAQNAAEIPGAHQPEATQPEHATAENGERDGGMAGFFQKDDEEP